MGVHGFNELKLELVHQLQISVNLLEHRINDQPLSAGPAGEQICVGAGRLVEELAEDHGAVPSDDSCAATHPLARRGDLEPYGLPLSLRVLNFQVSNSFAERDKPLCVAESHVSQFQSQSELWFLAKSHSVS